MKKLTIVFSICLVFLFCGVMTFVAISKDFTPPEQGSGSNENSPIWNKSYDDFVKYMADNGFIDSSKYDKLSQGVATIARKYGDVEIYWWDVKKLAKDSDEYKAYNSLKDDGYIDLWGSGNIFSPPHNGPFALGLTSYKGDNKKIIEALNKFGQ